jgi:hypothetical protein
VEFLQYDSMLRIVMYSLLVLAWIVCIRCWYLVFQVRKDIKKIKDGCKECKKQ